MIDRSYTLSAYENKLSACDNMTNAWNKLGVQDIKLSAEDIM